MRFNLVYGNHTDLCIIEDVLRYVRLSLVKLGHIVEYNRSLTRDACNIVLEAFNKDSADVIINAANDGAEIITIVSEYVTGDTFNNHTLESALNSFASRDIYTNRGLWKARFDNCVRVMGVSRAIWCLAGHCQLQTYRDLTDADRVHVIPLEYLATYATVQHQPDQKKDIDFLFTGTMSKRRLEILNALSSSGAKVESSNSNTPAYIRDELIGRSKICLNLLQTDDWKYASSLRFFYHLMNSSYIVSEHFPLPTSAIDQYIDTFDTSIFVDVCMDILREGAYTERARQKLSGFRNAPSEDSGFKHLLDLTYGLMTRPSGTTDRSTSNC